MTNSDQPPADESAASEYRIGDDTVVETILHAVGDVTDTCLTTEGPVTADGGSKVLPPLYDAVDPDALTRLSSDSATDADVRITFPFAGCTVTVAGNDAVLVTEGSSPTDSGDRSPADSGDRSPTGSGD